MGAASLRAVQSAVHPARTSPRPPGNALPPAPAAAVGDLGLAGQIVGHRHGVDDLFHVLGDVGVDRSWRQPADRKQQKLFSGRRGGGGAAAAAAAAGPHRAAN